MGQTADGLGVDGVVGGLVVQPEARTPLITNALDYNIYRSEL